MPMHIKGGFKSKNGLVTYGNGGAYGAGPAAKRMMKKASKGLEALAAANPELTYTSKATEEKARKKKDMMMYGGGMDPKKMKKAMYGTSNEA